MEDESNLLLKRTCLQADTANGLNRRQLGHAARDLCHRLAGDMERDIMATEAAQENEENDDDANKENQQPHASKPHSHCMLYSVQ